MKSDAYIYSILFKVSGVRSTALGLSFSLWPLLILITNEWNRRRHVGVHFIGSPCNVLLGQYLTWPGLSTMAHAVVVCGRVEQRQPGMGGVVGREAHACGCGESWQERERLWEGVGVGGSDHLLYMAATSTSACSSRG